MITQISVFLENRTGQLCMITDELAKTNVNIRAINIAETEDYGVLRFVCDKSAVALDVLDKTDFLVTTAQVVAVAIPDKIGGLNELLVEVGKNNIDIEYMYSIFGKADGLAYMIFKVENPEQLTEVFKNAGYRIADGKVLDIN